MPSVYHVVFHRPGPKWQAGVDFEEQPGIAAHVTHYARFRAQGKLKMGGPLLATDHGGMMVAKVNVSLEELEAFAAEDPAVQSGLLVYEVVPWYVPMED